MLKRMPNRFRGEKWPCFESIRLANTSDSADDLSGMFVKEFVPSWFVTKCHSDTIRIPSLAGHFFT